MYGATNPYDVVHNRAVIFEKDFSHSKNWENGPKIKFFEFFKKFGHQFSLKIYIIFSVPAQILYWEIFCS